MIEIKLSKKQWVALVDTAAAAMTDTIATGLEGHCSVSEKEMAARLLKDPSFAKALQKYFSEIVESSADDWTVNGVYDSGVTCKTYTKVYEESKRQAAARDKAEQARRKAQQKNPAVVEAVRLLKEHGYTVRENDEDL
jgi:2-iminoacetate synthase ThiH